MANTWVKLLFCLFVLLPPRLFAYEFNYTYNQGDQYRFLSTVNSRSSFGDGEIVESEILNRIAFKVEEVDPRGRGLLVGTVHTSEQQPNLQTAALWTTDYNAEFWRDRKGFYEVAPQYFMPMVRNVPRFPVGDIVPGARWEAPGEEVHDITQLLNLKAPFHIPFTAQYTYVGIVDKDGKKYHKITVKYAYETQFPRPFGRARLPNEAYAVAMAGSYDQNIYWDEEINQPAWYEETYSSEITFSNGEVYTTEGNANAYLIEAKPMDKSQMREDILTEAKRLGLNNFKVETSTDGVKLIFDNIQFRSNTAQFLPHEEEKLEAIGALLQRYPDRDIAIIGHTAKAGTEEEAQQLSEERALAVADFLIANKFRLKDHLITLGKGSSQPIASNTTATGMAQNRRVEITILEN